MSFLKSHWHKIIFLLWFVAFLYFIIRLYNVDYFKIKNINTNQIIEYIKQFGILAPVIYIVLFAIRPLVLLPATILVVLAGVIFGKFWGLVYAILGAMLSATLEFFVVRYLAREKIAKLIKGKLAYADEAIQKHGFKTVFLIRFIPNVAFDIQNFSLGLTRIVFRDYFFATLLGIAPAIILYVYFGYAINDFTNLWKITLVICIILAAYFLLGYFRKTSSKYPRQP